LLIFLLDQPQTLYQIALCPLKGDLRAIARARHFRRLTMNNIKQNLFFAFIYNAGGMPIAAGILYPFFG